MNGLRDLRRRIILRLRDFLTGSPEHFAPHGIRVWIPRNADPTVRYLLARGRPYEQPECDLVRSHLVPGMPVIELGGCMGVISATIRATIGPSAPHVVVEAMSELARICEVNAASGAAPGATSVIVAAIDYSGRTSVRFAPGPNAHSGSLAKPGESGVDVRAVTLSEVASRMPDGEFALVCDIEGTEVDLIARESSVLDRVRVLILETHPASYPDPQRALGLMQRRLEERGLHLRSTDGNVWCFLREAPSRG
jgi:FkbM family methyltransferase